jgi:hypothetical protein
VDAALLIAYAEKGGAEDNWPAPLIGLLVVAIILVIAGVAYMILGGRGDRRSEAG